MQYQFTPAANRALCAAAGWNSRENPRELDTPALLLGLLEEPECRAAIFLAAHGVDTAAVRRRWTTLREITPPRNGLSAPPRPFSADVELSLQHVCERAAECPLPLELATEHLLLGLVAARHEASAWLREQGLDPDTLEAEIHRRYGYRPGPLPQETGPLPEETDPLPEETDPLPEEKETSHEQIRVLRVIDAAANRAREALRVVEDHVRFILDDRHLTGQCKQLRHDLAAVLNRIPTEHLLAGRETQADVGTALTTSSEARRENSAGVLRANFMRLQEALRSLEEFGKLLDPDMAAAIKQLRYGTYTLQRAVEITRTSLQRLDAAKLYVLIDGCASVEAFQRLARSLVEAGVDMLQLRDKQLDDRRLLQRARLLRELTSGGHTLCIINDRPDLAVLSRADGVHIGQEELTVKDARTIVGPEALIGVSTHSIEQARQAVLDGANYLGVGPTFPSGTKQFDEFPGLDLLHAVATEIRLPAFAIGGITPENLPKVLSTRITRVAAGGAITMADDAAAVARRMLSLLR